MHSIDPVIYDKLLRYCDYRERATSEVLKKMMNLGILESVKADYIQALQDEGLLDELRYARAFAEGKVRIKGWGLRKVKMHLAAKRVEGHIIETALSELDANDYMHQLRELAEHKLERVKGANEYERKSKVFRFLQQRGYESDKIHSVLFQ